VPDVTSDPLDGDPLEADARAAVWPGIDPRVLDLRVVEGFAAAALEPGALKA